VTGEKEAESGVLGLVAEGLECTVGSTDEHNGAQHKRKCRRSENGRKKEGGVAHRMETLQVNSKRIKEKNRSSSHKVEELKK